VIYVTYLILMPGMFHVSRSTAQRISLHLKFEATHDGRYDNQQQLLRYPSGSKFAVRLVCQVI